MNVLAVLLGTAVGVLFGRLIPARIRTTAMAAIGLAVLGIGLQMAIAPAIDPAKVGWTGPLPFRPDPLVVIVGLVLGGILGELLQVERRLERFGERMQGLAARFGPARRGGGAGPGAAATGEQSHRLVEGFVTASLLFCVGAMAILGSIQDAAGQPEVLYVKALIDGVSAVMLASTLGGGVGLSGVALLVYQGGITLAAGSVAPYLTLPALATLTASGGLLIAAIGLDLLGLKRLPVGNLLPGVFLAAALAHFVG